MIAETQMLRLESQRRQPLHCVFFPVRKPFQICSGLAEEFHLHLLELSCAEREIAGCDLIAEGLADLADAERQMLSRCSLHILEVDENALRGFGAKIQRVRSVFRDSLKRLEHQVELADIRPVELAAGRTGNLELVDKAHHLVVGPAVNGAVQRKIMFLRIVLNQIVRAESLAASLAVHKRIGKSSKMAGSNPGLGIHQDRAVNADIGRGLLHEFLPPCFLDIVLELNAEVAVIPGIRQSAVNLGAGIDKASRVAKSNDLIHCLFHNSHSSSWYCNYDYVIRQSRNHKLKRIQKLLQNNHARILPADRSFQ